MWNEIKGKRACVWDAECNGFIDTMDECLVISITDVDTGKTKSYRDPHEAFEVLDTYDIHVGHNLIGFDYPMADKHYGWRPKKDIIILDTLWMSRMYYCDIEGGHSLGAWGERLGEPKMEYYPVSDPEQDIFNPDEPNPAKNPCWVAAHWTQMMQDYCEQDTKVNRKLYLKLVTLLANFSWQSIQCEMLTAALIQRQMTHGFVFDYMSAEILHAELMQRKMEIEDEVLQTFLPLPKKVREVQPKVKADHTVSSVGLKKLPDWENVVPVPEFTVHEKPEDTFVKALEGEEGAFYDDGNWWKLGETRVQKTVEYHSGSFTLIDWPEFSLGSRAQIAERLTRTGYKLTKFTEKGSPIIDDVVLNEAADAGIHEAKLLAEYFLITKREGMVRDWISKAKWHEDQGVFRIHGYVNSMGAATNRMTHSSPNVAQVPGAYSPYGEKCRALFTVRKGYKLVGCDASGLELRCLAHYMNDPAYSEAIVNGDNSKGTDIHTLNQKAAGLATRNQAKTFIYAFLYGAGDAKIGAIVGGNSKDGKALKEKFLQATPALKALKDRVANAVKQRAWVRGIDGRIIRVRSPHAALNTLLQGMGAIVMKYWLIEVARVADSEGLDWAPQANVHDEGQFEVLEAHVPRFKEICEQAFLTVTEILNVNCLLEGEAMEGDTWFDTH